jgi:hypothetical protein
MNTHFIRQSLWFTAGLGIGAGSTWLFATREGRRTRRRIAHTVRDGRKRLTETGHDIFGKGTEMLDRGKQFVKETRFEVGRRLHAGR